MGPTASGKTDLALRLADALPVSLISVDSALIYRGMDIGTAKPDAQTLARYPHALIDIRDPAESYSAAEFRDDALQLIQQAHQQQRLPVLVGGTMMYFNALQQGLAVLPASDPALRAELEAQRLQQGNAALHQRLQQVDPVMAARLNTSDSQRIQRALEVYLLSGKPLSQHWQEQEQVELPFRILPLALMPDDRAWLHARIALRFDLMLELGFEAEVRQLHQRADLHAGLPSIRCVGYRQMWDYLDGRLEYAQMRERGIVATRQLAKRQYTWLRGWPELAVLQGEDENLFQHALKLIRTAVI